MRHTRWEKSGALTPPCFQVRVRHVCCFLSDVYHSLRISLLRFLARRAVISNFLVISVILAKVCYNANVFPQINAPLRIIATLEYEPHTYIYIYIYIHNKYCNAKLCYYYPLPTSLSSFRCSHMTGYQVDLYA